MHFFFQNGCENFSFLLHRMFLCPVLYISFLFLHEWQFMYIHISENGPVYYLNTYLKEHGPCWTRKPSDVGFYIKSLKATQEEPTEKPVYEVMHLELISVHIFRSNLVCIFQVSKSVLKKTYCKKVWNLVCLSLSLSHFNLMLLHGDVRFFISTFKCILCHNGSMFSKAKHEVWNKMENVWRLRRNDPREAT